MEDLPQWFFVSFKRHCDRIKLNLIHRSIIDLWPINTKPDATKKKMQILKIDRFSNEVPSNINLGESTVIQSVPAIQDTSMHYS